MDKNIVDQLIGQRINELRVMSFFINTELVCEIVALYVNIEDGTWYKITTSDGFNVIKKILDEPKIIKLSSIKNEFAYPVKRIDDNIFFGKIINLKEYLWKGKRDEGSGIYIEVENSEGFSIIERDGCISIETGVKLENNYILLPVV